MKNVLLCLIALLIFNISSLAQAPEKFKYQAIITDNKDHPVRNKTIGLEISILQSNLNGIIVYQETFTTRTSNDGLVNLEIGTGMITSGVFSDINWGMGPYYLGIAVDMNGSGNYISMGASQLLSVPYALYAKQAQAVDGDNDTDPTNEIELPETANENDILVFNGTAWVALANEDGDPTNELELPEVDGAAGQVLTTDGEGMVSWQTPVGASLESLLIENNDGGLNQIKNIEYPGDEHDVAIKGYVDIISQMGNIESKSYVDTLVAALNIRILALETRIVALEETSSCPGIPEICGNGIDDNCDGVIDENCDVIIQERLDLGETPKEIIESGLSSSYLIGKTYQGGLIYFITEDGTWGQVASPNDITNIEHIMFPWDYHNFIQPGDFYPTLAEGIEVGSGPDNTRLIVDQLEAGLYAAFMCDNYDDGTYSDWFLPSLGELKLMYEKIGGGALGSNNNIGNFIFNRYWSSTEGGGSSAQDNAYFLNFYGGNEGYSYKNELYYIRTISI